MFQQNCAPTETQTTAIKEQKKNKSDWEILKVTTKRKAGIKPLIHTNNKGFGRLLATMKRLLQTRIFLKYKTKHH